ncbi:MAG: plasmid pRiA4b ORF-3 family protein [Deltaproteobacteria bacterium]|jgi:hypothetical protein|nr:plasmid pRiA4b ORF-3 family protein [Deltaproteobacteria bacterium]
MSDSPKTKSDQPPKTAAKKAPSQKAPKKAPPKAALTKTPREKASPPTEPVESGQGAPKAQADQAPLYSFRIELKRITPKIWRDFYVPADTDLLEFHRLLARVMGWHGRHLFFFVIGGVEYYNPNLGRESEPGLLNIYIEEEEGEAPFKDLDEITLDSLGLKEGDKIQYVYDMGDDWEHVITVKSLNYVPAKLKQRRGCLGGARACPPEDCGGVPGYQRVLAAVADPEHKGIDDISSWVNASYDPTGFDPDRVNQNLR